MRRILGIDPGSRVTGYGVIDSDGVTSIHVASGCIRLSGDSMAERLGVIFRDVKEVVSTHRPVEMAIEQVFVSRNAASALKLGQARGAAICAAVECGLPVSEYSAREVKQAVVGSGAADKAQVQHMVRIILGLKESLRSDQADALAVALSHAHAGATLRRMDRVWSGVRS